MKAILNRESLKVALAAEVAGESRPILKCVKIGNGEIVACDGIVFAKCRVDTVPVEGEDILIKAVDIMAAARAIPRGNIKVETHDGTATLTSEEEEDKGTASVSIHVKLQEGTFPDSSEMVPKVERKAYVAMSKTVLNRTLEIMKYSDDALLKFKVREPSHPVVITAGNMTIYAMPMYRPEDDEGLGYDATADTI